MRPQKALKQLGPLLSAPSFTSRDAARVGVSSAVLHHYIGTGEIERIGRGVYRSKDAPQSEDFRWEDLIAAVRAVNDGVICLTSALAIYDLTEEIPRQHWIAIRNTTRHRAGSQIRIVRMRNVELGRSTVELSGLILPIFDRERTIVDAFRYLGRETAIKALKAATQKRGRDKIDFEKLQKYARQLRVDIEPYILAVTT